MAVYPDRMASPPVTRSAWIALVIGTVFVAVGIGLVISGFGDETPAEKTMLDLSGLAFSAAVLTAIVQMTLETKVLLRGNRVIGSLYAIAGALLLMGLVVFGVGLTVGPRNLAATGTLITWAGLGLAFCFLVWQALKRERPIKRAEVLEEWLEEEPAADGFLEHAEELPQPGQPVAGPHPTPDPDAAALIAEPRPRSLRDDRET